MIDFEIRGQQYRAGRVSALTQFAIGKRLLPLITAIGPEAMRSASAAIQAQRQAKAESAEESAPPPPPFDFTSILAPLADAVAALPDEDANFIFRECCKVTKRKSGDAWVGVWNVAAADFQFEDLNALDLIQIAANVMMEHISDFSPGPLVPNRALSPAG